MRNRSAHAFRQELTTLSQSDAQINWVSAYSQPTNTERLGEDYDLQGRLSAAEIMHRVASLQCDYYLCGPLGFMTQMSRELLSLEVPSAQIITERFGDS